MILQFRPGWYTVWCPLTVVLGVTLGILPVWRVTPWGVQRNLITLENYIGRRP